MPEPDIRRSRQRVAIGTVAALALALVGFLAGRATAPGHVKAVVTAPSPAIIADLAKLDFPQNLGRADILRIGDEAASSWASGTPLPDAVRKVVGRRFDLVLPFGCTGPAPEGSRLPLRWQYDAGRQALTLHAEMAHWAPSSWGLTDALAQAQPKESDASLGGFWVRRPWVRGDTCPRTAPRTDGFPALLLDAPRTLALAELVPPEGRLGNRPYEAVLRMPEARLAASDGFRLRVKGRVTAHPGGNPTACVGPGGINQHPVCVIGATFDELRIENPITGDTLAVWSVRTTPRRRG